MLAALDGDKSALAAVADIFLTEIPRIQADLASSLHQGPRELERSLHEAANSLAAVGAYEAASCLRCLQSESTTDRHSDLEEVGRLVETLLHQTAIALSDWLDNYRAVNRQPRSK